VLVLLLSLSLPLLVLLQPVLLLPALPLLVLLLPVLLSPQLLQPVPRHEELPHQLSLREFER
jgi:hypothetical protein